MRKNCTLVLFDDDGNVIPNNTTNSPNDVIENQNDVIDLSADRPQGEWTSECACSLCGCQPWYERDIHTYNYCPNCGARMRGAE